jgi:hypothetical protein
MEAIAAEVLSALPLEVEMERTALAELEAHSVLAEPGSPTVLAEVAPHKAPAEPAPRTVLTEPPPHAAADCLAPKRGEALRGPQVCAAPAAAATGCAEHALCVESEGEPAPAPDELTPGAPESAAPHEPQARGTPARAATGCADQRPCEESERAPDATPAPELPPFLASLVVGLESADAFELDERLRRAVALEQRLEAEMGPLLLRIAEGRLHRAAGFATMDEYARERLGISPRKARALLRLERAGRRARLLREAYRDGRLSWVQAHALVPVLAIAGSHQRAWIDWACGVTVRRLQEDVERALILYETDPERFEQTAGLPNVECDAIGEAQCVAKHEAHGDAKDGAREAVEGDDQDTAQREADGAAQAAAATPERQTGAKPTHSDETCRVFWNGPRDVAQLFRAVLCTVRRHIERRTGRLPSDGEALDAMLEHAFEAWIAGSTGTGTEGMGGMGGLGGSEGLGPERVRAAHRVFARDGWRCTVPGCSSYRELHDHHIRFRSAGGSDDESNRTTLCAWHHLRGVHAGPARLRLRLLGRAPRRLRFELGLRRGAPALLRYDAGDRLRPAHPAASDRNRELVRNAG